MIICRLYSLESPRRSNSNEYTQHIIYAKIRYISRISLNDCFLEISEEFSRDLKRARISNGKRAISVRVIEDLLYVEAAMLCSLIWFFSVGFYP